MRNTPLARTARTIFTTGLRGTRHVESRGWSVSSVLVLVLVLTSSPSFLVFLSFAISLRVSSASFSDVLSSLDVLGNAALRVYASEDVGRLISQTLSIGPRIQSRVRGAPSSCRPSGPPSMATTNRPIAKPSAQCISLQLDCRERRKE